MVYPTRMPLNPKGRPVDDVIADLEAKRAGDVRWKDGRTVRHDLRRRAVGARGRRARGLAVPARERAQHQGVPVAGPDPVRGRRLDRRPAARPRAAAGFLTSGGTESILCAVKAARERGRKERGITAPEMIVAESAHAAFHKAAHLFGITLHKTPVLADWTADVDAMAEQVNDNTVLVVGSAPQYPQGVVDRIPRIAELAASVDANCHVDACMGGFVLPFVEMLGRDVPPWDFRVDGVQLDLGRHPQARLRAQGRVGDPAPHQGAAPLPDLRVRRLARRLLRLAEPPGHPLGSADGRGLGRDAAPRHRGLLRAHPDHPRECRPHARRHRRHRREFACSATAATTWSP